MRRLECDCNISGDKFLCEKCGSSINQDRKKEALSLNWRAIRSSFTGFTFGLIAFILVISKYSPTGGIVLSLIGLFFTSYSMGVMVSINMQKRQKIIIFSIAAIGSIISAVSFIFGLQSQFT